MKKISLPKMKKPQLASRVFELHYYDAAPREVYVTDKSEQVRDGSLLVSNTDAHGIITHANRAFVETTGFTHEELIGKPHCIVRHPDMPAVIFENMWNKLNAGEEWHGYLKNLCKNGNYYWVNANIKPTIIDEHITGYTSVRRAINSKLITQLEALYAEMLRQEALTPPVRTKQHKAEEKPRLFRWKK